MERQGPVRQGSADPARGGRALSAARAALGIIALLALLLAVYAPLVAVALAVAGVLALCVAWLKASIRARRWFPWREATPAEGVFGGSGLILLLCGALVVGLYAERLNTISGGEVTLFSLYSGDKVGGRRVSLGDATMQQELKKRLEEAAIPFTVTTQDGKEFLGWSAEHNAAAQKIMESLHAGPRAGSSVSYSNPETQQRLKDELAKAGIPFTTSTREGKEFVGWSPEHNVAAEKIQENLHGPRGIHFGSAQSQKDFVTWLAKRRIKSAIVRHEGNDYVTWDDPRQPKEMMDAFIAERPPSRCGPDKAKPKAKC